MLAATLCAIALVALALAVASRRAHDRRLAAGRRRALARLAAVCGPRRNDAERRARIALVAFVPAVLSRRA